jgi:DNA repair protein RecO (recombination protein O)
LLNKTRAIVLRAVKYSETSIIATLYTELHGVQSFIIKGVRTQKSKSPKAALLQVMSMLEVVTQHTQNRDLGYIRELKAGHVFSHLPYNVYKLSIGQFMVELVRATQKEPEPNTDLFHFFWNALHYLDAYDGALPNFALYFLLEYTRFLGIKPDTAYTPDTPYFDLKEGCFTAVRPPATYCFPPEYTPILSQLLFNPLEEVHQIPLNRQQRQLLIEKILQYYTLHLGTPIELKTVHIFSEIL